MDDRSDSRSDFGALLRRFRLAAGLSQEELAERAHMSTVGVGALERGDRHLPYRETVLLLARALELSENEGARLEAAVPRGQRPRRTQRQPTTARLESHEGRLPIPLTSFLARSRECIEVLTLVRERRLVTLCGPAGVGKTRLAFEITALAFSAFPDGVRVVDLASISSDPLVLPTIASALGLRDCATSLDASILAFVRDASMLVLVDNCEHVLATCAEIVGRLVAASPHLHILATSREPLRIDGERIFPVEPLACETTDATTMAPAVQLFFERAADAGSTLDPRADLAAIATICRRLDGLPLAIELAAAWTPSLSAGAISQALVEPFALLGARHRDVSTRHHTLDATLAWSYDLLTARERAVFRSCAIFCGGWTLEGVRAVATGEAIDDRDIFGLVTALVDKSLVVALPQTTGVRYRLLETTREYALRLLRGDDAYARVAMRHARYYASMATHADDAYDDTPTPTWLAPLRPEIDNFRAALRFALADPASAPIAAALAGGLHWFWYHLGSHREGLDWCEASLAALRPAGNARTEARLHLAIVSFSSSVRGLHARVEPAERAIALYRRLDEPTKLVAALRSGAETIARCGRLETADALATEAVAIARSLGHSRLVAEALRTKSFTMRRDAFDARRAVLAESISLLNQSDHDDGVALSLLWLGEVEFAAGCYGTALACARVALATFRRLSFEREVVICLANIAAYHLASGNLDRARDVALEALAKLATGVEVSGGLSTILQHLATIAIENGEAERAARLLGFCDARRIARDQPRFPTETALYERATAELVRRLGADGARAAMAVGAAYREAEAIAEALTSV